MALTEAKIKNSKAADKSHKLFDGGGLFLLVVPSGGKWWRFKYRLNGKEKGLSFGVYPDVSLKRARELREEARALVAAGIDPSAERRAKKSSWANTFEAIAREWLALQEKPPKHSRQTPLAVITLTKARWMLETFVFPKLGSCPIHEITAPDLLEVLRAIEQRGTHETAHRTKQRCGQIFRYAIATRRATRDITQDLKGALAPVVTTNHAAITEPARIGELLRAIDGYVGQPVTHAALKLAPFVFVRPGELRAAEWKEFDMERAEWRIAAERTKLRKGHLVPLSTQAIAILKELEPLTGDARYVFPSLRSSARPISENTLNAALRRLGYASDEMTAHGFRALASTCLNEQGFAPDVIELQLAHKERNKVRAAYNRAERLEERRKMMQSWADYLDTLKSGGAKVVPIRSRTGGR